MTFSLNGLTPLNGLGTIRVQGEDAARFLHGQLTQDFLQLPPEQARLAAFLSANGRMQASFIGWRPNDAEVLLICSRDVLPPVLKRLSMFVLRAKARLGDATSDFALWGLAGDAVLAAAGGDAQPPWSRTDTALGTLIHLYPAAGQPRALLAQAAGQPMPDGTVLAAGLWEWSEVQSGVATLTAPLVDRFVPQMLNYESVGGVNFKKGCYPGQEIVARSQFRGTIKRRTYLAHAPEAVAVGADVFATNDTEQPCGTVVQSAAAPDSGFVALAALQVASTGEPLSVGGPQGVPLSLNDLPYPLREDI